MPRAKKGSGEASVLQPSLVRGEVFDKIDEKSLVQLRMLVEQVRTGAAEEEDGFPVLGAFDTLPKTYLAQVMDIKVPRTEDKQNDYIFQSVNMVIALSCYPGDLEFSSLWGAGFEREVNEEGEDYIIPSPNKKSVIVMTTKKFGFRLKPIHEPGAEWREFAPELIKTSYVIPEQNKKVQTPTCLIYIEATALDFPVGGELWYPYRFQFQFVPRKPLPDSPLEAALEAKDKE